MKEPAVQGPLFLLVAFLFLILPSSLATGQSTKDESLLNKQQLEDAEHELKSAERKNSRAMNNARTDATNIFESQH